jgi:hypothetical protein
MYYGAPKAAYVTLILAATTGFWMRLPAVVAEFERGKRATLARAQRAIAYSLVGCWAITVMLTSFSPNKSQLLNAPAKRRLHDGKPKHNPARHASLSAAVLTDV